MKRTIVIAGANGFMGRYLSEFFLKKNWQVKAFARREEGLAEGVEFHRWDGETLDNWKEQLEGAEALINLAGRTVNCRYTDKHKAEIIDSRVNSTSVLGVAVGECSDPPKVWLNASTATIYRNAIDKYQTESEGDIGEGFSVDVAKAWESAFNDARVDDRVRKVTLRTSLVIADEEGTVLEILRGLAKKGLGGKMGSGKQMVSWIHIEDTCRAVEWMIENPEAEGAYNLVAPEALTNEAMMKLIRKDVGAWIGLPAMAWMLEIGAFFMRTETELIVKSRWVYPERLLEEGFVFEKERFEDVLK